MPVILGVKVDAVTRKEAQDYVSRLLSTGGQHLITTPNPEMLVAAQQDLTFREILNQAALALPDGVGLMWAARALGTPLKERIPGVDFVWDIARLAAKKGYMLCLFGGKGQVAQHAAKVLRTKYSALKVVADECGEKLTIVSFSPKRSDIEKIKIAQPDIILVALGHGKQEKWIAAHLAELPSVKIAMGVGGALDFIAGRVRRAPRLMRALGLEWLWRLLRQPWRLPRIWRATIIFPWLVIRTRLRGIMN